SKNRRPVSSPRQASARPIYLMGRKASWCKPSTSGTLPGCSPRATHPSGIKKARGSKRPTKVRADCYLVFLDLSLCLENRPDTVGELSTAEISVSYMPSLKAEKLEKLTQEKAVLER